jgi:hypothetical protein
MSRDIMRRLVILSTELYAIKYMNWNVMERMEEWISGLFYKQEDYNVELFHKIPGV